MKNRTRDMEIKYKLTVTRGYWVEGNGRKRWIGQAKNTISRVMGMDNPMTVHVRY